MVRPLTIDSNGMKKGAWSEDEDNKLRAYIERYGHWNWRLLPKYAGLKRCGKSCRLRWVNYLKPGVKRGNFTKEEQELVVKLHLQLGNKWSAIAEKLPGRTDNEIKNFWHTRVDKRRKPNPAVKKTTAQPISKASPTEYSASEATSLSTSQPLSLPFAAEPSLSTNAQDQLDLMLSEILEADTNYAQNECNFAPMFVEEFDYPELRYTELWCSGANKWTADDEVCGSFWYESSTPNTSNSESETSSYAPLEEEGLLYYDPLLQYF